MSEKIGIRPATITINEGKVLLVRSEYNGKEFFLFPGGGLEVGETLEEGAIRETLEETGIKVIIKKLVHINEYIYKSNWEKRSIIPFFLAECENETKINSQTDDEGKIKEAVWVKIKDLANLDIRPKIIVESLINSSNEKEFSFPPYSIDYKE